MLFLFLPFFSLSIVYDIPRFSVLFAYDDIISNTNDYYIEHWDEFKEYVKGNSHYLNSSYEREIYNLTVDSLDSFKFSNGRDFANILSKIPKSSEFLFIFWGNCSSNYVNLNDLPRQFSVFFIHNFQSYPDYVFIQKFIKKMVKSSFDGSQKSIMRLTDHFSKKNNKKKVPKESDRLILNGNIKRKVSSLVIVDNVIEFRESLNCHYLFLSNVIVIGSYAIKTEYLIVDQNTFENINLSPRTIDVKEFGLYLQSTENYKYRIIYSSRNIQIDEKLINYPFNNYIWSAPYQIFKTFSLVVFTSLNFDIHVDETNVTNLPNLNITILDQPMLTYVPLLLESKETVKVWSSGNWRNYTNKPKVIITLNRLRYDVNSYSSDLDVIVKNLYKYTSSFNAYAVPLQTRTNYQFIPGIIAAMVITAVTLIALIIAVSVYSCKLKHQIMG